MTFGFVDRHLRRLAIAGGGGWLVLVLAATTFAQDVAENANPNAAAISSLQNQLDMAEQQKERIQSDQRELERHLSAIGDRRAELYHRQDQLGVSNESFPEILKMLQMQRVELTIKLAGLEARRQTMLELRKQDDAEAVATLVAPLEALLKLEQSQLDRSEQLFQKSVVSEMELGDARRRLLEVQIRLAEARQAIASSPQRNEDLLVISLDRAETQARLETTETLLRQFAESRETLDQSSAAEREANAVMQRLTQAMTTAAELDAKIADIRAQLESLGNTGGR